MRNYPETFYLYKGHNMAHGFRSETNSRVSEDSICCF